MSIKNIVKFSFVLLVLAGCERPEPKPEYYAYYTKEQRDSLSKVFDDMSNYMSQPTDKHRLYKDSAIILSPQNTDIRAQLSYSYKKRGDHIKAMKILNEAVEMDIKKGSYDLLKYRSWSYIYFYRDYEGTIADVDQITKMSKRTYNVCWGEPCGLLKGLAQYKLKKYHEAINTFDTVLIEEAKLGFSPESSFLIYFYKGRCNQELKNYPEALKNYGLVLRFDPNFTEALYQSGLIYTEMKDIKRAKTNLEKAMVWVKLEKKMGEPYFERFDEVFEYQITDALSKL
jgi:tetratricopeptide (TPR) repeat protein